MLAPEEMTQLSGPLVLVYLIVKEVLGTIKNRNGGLTNHINQQLISQNDKQTEILSDISERLIKIETKLNP